MKINFLVILIFHCYWLDPKFYFNKDLFSPRNVDLIINQKVKKFPFLIKSHLLWFYFIPKTPSLSDH